MIHLPGSLTGLTASGVIAVIRSDESQGLVQAAEALAIGGIRALEFTLNTPDALKLISQARQKLADHVMVGAGTVITAEDVTQAVQAGAQFVVMPGQGEAAVKTAKQLGVIVIPGAFTPTEALNAWQWGADMIKIFPASLGGPDYIRALLAPLSDLKLVPTGGVSAANAGAYIQAGAAAVAVGGSLVSRSAIQSGEFHRLEEAARNLLSTVAQARLELSA
ncbi:MAG: bifunctional 4-hydroxy-2-oxoglutarate aldolase/2-dehydro-3-deoxy-phosphogluconate aldolase [Anaerolineae bacterium]|nr:bifunctional 4-hydroxy-2-oxoglutarate aldolase/2-dehydro-3-deoxy-phosphogluconate aldolase [Anaerolineae bacterium]